MKMLVMDKQSSLFSGAKVRTKKKSFIKLSRGQNLESSAGEISIFLNVFKLGSDSKNFSLVPYCKELEHSHLGCH